VPKKHGTREMTEELKPIKLRPYQQKMFDILEKATELERSSPIRSRFKSGLVEGGKAGEWLEKVNKELNRSMSTE